MRSVREFLLCLFAFLIAIPALALEKPTVTISPGYSTIGVSTTLQYSATVTGLKNTAVVWKINGVARGNATLGTISSSGLYLAPAKIPAGQLLVEALASDHVTLGVVYVVLAPAGPSIASLSASSIPVGNFTATVSGSGFAVGSLVRAAGVTLSTKFVNSTTLTISGYQGGAGSIAFQAQNPGTLWGPVFNAQFAAPAGQADAPQVRSAPQRTTDSTELHAAAETVAAPPAPSGEVSIKIDSPLFGWQVVPGATRRIHATVLNGATRRVKWTYTTVGGATATVTPAASPNIVGAFVDVTVGSSGSACIASGKASATVISSTASVKLTATSVDDPAKSVTVPVSVCRPKVQVFVSPFNLRLYSGQMADLQSWVWGNANDNVTWAISQPAGGNGRLIAPPAGGDANTSRDAVFSATAAGTYTVTATSAVNPEASASATLSVDSVGLPYPVTRNHTAPVDCSVETSKSGKTYDVGVGHTYANLAAVYKATGSNTLKPGTTIRLFNTDTTGTNPTRYHEYLRLDGEGTQAAPIRIVGCADAAGNLPILDASNATAYSPSDNSVAAQIAGMYQIGLHHSQVFGTYPTINSPSYIIIEGLAFRNAYPTTGSTENFYFAPGSSTPKQWGVSASCIRPYEGSHITVRGNDMQDCADGILADFNGNNAWGGFFGDFDLEGNYFTNLGNGSASYHMAYVQGFRQVIQGNVFDQMKPVSSGGELKMRGVGEVVRYNYFGSSTNTRTVDFVEEQDSNMYMSFAGYYYAGSGRSSFHAEYPADAYTPDMIAASDEVWHKAYAYGNVVNFGPKTPSSAAPIHFFGDQSAYGDEHTNPPFRVGDLFDYSNTFYSVGGSSMHLVDTQQNQDNLTRVEWPTLTLWNNAVYVGRLNPDGGVAFQMSTLRSDIFNLGPMWISSNFGTNSLTCSNNGGNACLGTGWPYQQETTQYMDGSNLPAHVNGLSKLIRGGTTVPFNTSTFVPIPGGGLVGAGAPLPQTISNMPVRFQISAPSYALTPRTNPLTLGAHD